MAERHREILRTDEIYTTQRAHQLSYYLTKFYVLGSEASLGDALWKFWIQQILCLNLGYEI